MSNNDDKAPATARLTFLHPRGSEKFTAEVDGPTTGRDALAGLTEAGFIETATANDAYSLELTRTSSSLPLSTSLIESGATEGDTVQIVLAQAAAGALSPETVRTRLALDYRVLRGLSSPHIESIRGYHGAPRPGQRGLSDTDCQAGKADCYLVELRMPIHRAPGELIDSTTLALTLRAGGNYPYSDPNAQIVSHPVPFTPHIQKASGAICIGSGWRRARGKMLAAQLVSHVMRILNFDEPATNDAFSADAFHHATRTLRGRPFTPDFQYPVLPVEAAYGVAARVGRFRQVQERKVGFRPTETPSPTSDFRRVLAS